MSDDLAKQLREARKRVGEIAAGRGWRMSIPVQPDDDDVLICRALDESADALEAKDARIAELERDARRYRWLRDEHDRVDPMARTVWKLHHDRNGSEWADVPGPLQLDAAIDNAIAQEKP